MITEGGQRRSDSLVLKLQLPWFLMLLVNSGTALWPLEGGRREEANTKEDTSSCASHLSYISCKENWAMTKRYLLLSHFLLHNAQSIVLHIQRAK
uniref:Uncharacterized protein n=1 Tax=Rhizophora mucronata TaxID=61149 RepID=A0A2P2JU48_RHIMU